MLASQPPTQTTRNETQKKKPTHTHRADAGSDADAGDVGADSRSTFVGREHCADAARPLQPVAVAARDRVAVARLRKGRPTARNDFKLSVFIFITVLVFVINHFSSVTNFMLIFLTSKYDRLQLSSSH